MSKPPRRENSSVSALLIETAAALLGCSEKAVRCRVARQQLPFRKLHGRIIFLRSELEIFLHELPGVTLAEAQRRSEGL